MFSLGYVNINSDASQPLQLDPLTHRLGSRLAEEPYSYEPDEDDSTEDDELDLVSDLREGETQELQAKQRVVTIKAFVN